VTDLLEAPTPAAAPGTYPIPAGRGRWRLTLHQRAYADTPVTSTVIAELSEARNRKLVRAWNTPAVLSMDLDGWRPAARYVAELATEIVAWRWDDTAGADVAYFRGPITASADAIDEQSHTVTLTATDYLGLLSRRILTTVTAAPSTWDQDTTADWLVTQATTNAQTSAGASLAPGSYLPFGAPISGVTSAVVPVNPDGTARALSGVARTVTYQGNSVCSTMLDDLAKLAGGFDYDVAPFSALVSNPATSCDALRIFYPHQGVSRTAALYYPGNVTALGRAVASADYSNYWRTLGNNQTSAQNSAQVYGEANTAAASGGQSGAVGLWMTGDSSADQTAGSALLGQGAAGNLNIYSVLVPTYTLTLAPNVYYEGAFGVGDTLPLVVQSGRLNVNTSLRVMGVTFEATDDGAEVVTVVVGRDPTTLADMLGDQAADIRALSRR
jgi:hypothetical protein